MRLAKFYLACLLFFIALYVFVQGETSHQEVLEFVGLHLRHGTLIAVGILGMASGTRLALKTIKEELQVKSD
jgi:hypothetical protein